MKLLNCPMNGPRNIEEFQYLGPVRDELDPLSASDEAWARRLFRAENRPGVIVEWWRHAPSNYIFLAERDIVSNVCLRTFDPSAGRGDA